MWLWLIIQKYLNLEYNIWSWKQTFLDFWGIIIYDDKKLVK